MTLQVEILNPKASKLLEDMADMKLISISKSKDNEFLKIITKLRSKAEKNPLSLKEITSEVELVRTKRYAKTKR